MGKHFRESTAIARRRREKTACIINLDHVPSLSYRRKRGDMIEVYKYMHGLYKVSALPVEVEEKTTRGHNYKLTKKRCSTTQRLKFFSMRVVNSFPLTL